MIRFRQIPAWLFAFFVVAACQQSKQPFAPQAYPIASVDLRQVVLADSFWLPMIRLIQDTTIAHAFKKCEDEGRMENFLVAGGKKAGKTRGKMPFDDTDLYKIIEGASYSLVSLPDRALDAYMDSVIAIIKTGQESDGYITTWFTIDRTQPPADWVKPSTHRWENEITSHELYNSGHLFEAAAAHYWATGKRTLLDIALKNADLLVANFQPGKLQRPPGHQIVETGLVKLYHITHRPAYLQLARYFIDLRGDSTTHALYGIYNQDHLPVTQQKTAVGHAVRAAYLYAGMADIAALYNDHAYRKALDTLWSNVVNTKMYITGGVGARHDGEAFGENFELPNLTAYNETCAAIGSVAWNQKMFQLSGHARYFDIVERTLYNAVIPGMSADGKTFFYPNPLESDGKYTFNKGACTRQSWFDCSCCPTNMIRFLPTLPSLIYATSGDTVYVNLFASSKATVKTENANIDIRQETGYPWQGTVRLTVKADRDAPVSLKLRVPGWAQHMPVPGDLYRYEGAMEDAPGVTVNGEVREMRLQNGYVTVSGNWKETSTIVLTLPMTVRKVVTNERVAENKHKAAFERGPIVYCAEAIDNPHFDDLILSDDVVMQPVGRRIVGRDVVVLTGSTPGGNTTLIPYYLWSNRGINKMTVWVPEAQTNEAIRGDMP